MSSRINKSKTPVKLTASKPVSTSKTTTKKVAISRAKPPIKSSILAKNSEGFSSRLTSALAKTNVEKSLGNLNTSIIKNTSSPLKLTKDGLDDAKTHAAKKSEAKALQQKITQNSTSTATDPEIEKQIEQDLLAISALQDTRPTDTDTAVDFEEENLDSAFNYAVPQFSGVESSTQWGPSQNDLIGDEKPKITAIRPIDIDANGSFESIKIFFKRLYAQQGVEILFRELAYQVWRKSIFDDKDYVKIADIQKQNFSQYKLNVVEDRNFQETQDMDKLMVFVDRDIQQGKVYSYKLFAIYDGESDNVIADNRDVQETVKRLGQSPLESLAGSSANSVRSQQGLTSARTESAPSAKDYLSFKK